MYAPSRPLPEHKDHNYVRNITFHIRLLTSNGVLCLIKADMPFCSPLLNDFKENYKRIILTYNLHQETLKDLWHTQSAIKIGQTEHHTSVGSFRQWLLKALIKTGVTPVFFHFVPLQFGYSAYYPVLYRNSDSARNNDLQLLRMLSF